MTQTVSDVCARCGKAKREYMGEFIESLHGGVMVCELCYIQEMFEKNGSGPKGPLQFPCPPYTGPEYWVTD